MPVPLFVTLAPPVARTVTGNGDPIDLTKFMDEYTSKPPGMLVQSNITSISGTAPTITYVIEDSLDGGVTWNTVGTFIAQTTANRLVIQVFLSGVAQAAGFRWPFNARKVRARWTVGGTTPSITGSVTAVLV